MSGKPSAIIFGGINTCSRALAALLVPPEGESLVSNLRIVDKYSVAPPTTYLGADFPKVLEKPNVEYRQANLTVPAIVSSAFDPSPGQEPYTYVFDLTGEISYDRSAEVQIGMTYNVARLVAQEAAKRKVKAYVRIMHPFYECKEKGKNDEKEDIKPDGALGTWWHETLRSLAAVEGLNLVILRTAQVYGPYVDHGIVITTIALAAVYGYLKQPLKAMYSPGKQPVHTVHIDDVAGALWACAEWMAKLGRKEADAVAGEVIPFKNEKSKVKEVEGVIPHDQKVIAPLFNLEDDGHNTMDDLAKILTGFFGAPMEYHNFFANQLVKFRLEDYVEEINETHVGTWTKMVAESDPPLKSLHYTVYMDNWSLKRHVVSFNAQKLKTIIGYQIRRPKIGPETLTEQIDKLKAEGSWPQIPEA